MFQMLGRLGLALAACAVMAGLVYGGYKLGKDLNYNLWYRSKVEATVTEMLIEHELIQEVSEDEGK